MITLYSGTPGSGKSLKAAERIYNIMKYQKRLIISNCNINLSWLKKTRSEYIYKDNDKITPDFLIQESFRWMKTHRFDEGVILLIIDECQLMFNARDWQQAGRAQWLSFFTLHRHYGYDIILIAQFDRMIDRQIRSLIEHEYIHRKCSNFGWKGKLISLFFGGNLFVQVKMWYPLKERMGAEFFRASRKYYRIYDSYTLLGTDPAPDPEPEKPETRVIPVEEFFKENKEDLVNQ